MDVASIFGLIVLVVVILALRKVLGALSPGSSGAARAGRARPDLSVEDLADTLRNGGLPTPVQASFRMQPGETCVGEVDADVEQWLEGDGSYTTKHVAWAGGLAGLAIGGAMNAVGNTARKAAARREMAERWRSIGSYRVYVTSERIAFEGGGREWHEMWLDDLRRLEIDGGALVLQAVGQPACRIHAAPAEYWYLLLRRLAFDELPGGQISA